MYRIKKHNNRNQYLHVGDDLWVRNPGIAGVPFIDINNLTSPDDYPIFLRNEQINNRMKYPWVDTENIVSEKAVIISDGFDFEKHHSKIADLPRSINIFAVNGALNKWQAKKRNPNFYVVNNPYPEAMSNLSSSVVKCIASAKTNCDFLQKYRGAKCRYCPAIDGQYCGVGNKECKYRIDDYRNPICAAINLLHRFGVKTLMLVFCDEAFADERPASVKSDDGMSYYPQHQKANNLIDGNLYWLMKNNGCRVAQNCVGPKLKTATYIPLEDINQFFQGK